jgi:hypothetical protein
VETRQQALALVGGIEVLRKSEEMATRGRTVSAEHIEDWINVKQLARSSRR